MDKIIKIHEEILDHLIKLRQSDSQLYFVPRKINNKGRLDKGYWFIGNEYYLHISFWNGTDWKEKIHNIGFVITLDGQSYIELSAQDSGDKAKFLEKVVSKIGGFTKYDNKNKWSKSSKDKDYIKNLDYFINEVKPVIDRLIRIDNPDGITMPDAAFFSQYGERVIKLRQKQIAFGSKNKICRICWNTEGWRLPSGSKGKSVYINAYEADKGYGHEEWLFDKSKIIEGYHYAFLQPLFLKSNKHEGSIYNISLFTVNNLKRKYFVGEIKAVECITKEESQRIYDIYKSEGWLEQMRQDVERVGANYEEFKQTPTESLFNIRFKFENAFRPDELVEISPDDVNLSTFHYKLLPRKTEIDLETINDESEGNLRNTNKRKKVFNSDCEYDPYHDQMQNAIFRLLKGSDFDYEKVYIKKGRVDIKAKTQQNTWHYFEVKTDNAKLSIRKALGQILEYAYFPNEEKAEKLIIISDEEPNEDVIQYLNHIRDKFTLPISYRCFNLDRNELSIDY